MLLVRNLIRREVHASNLVSSSSTQLLPDAPEDWHLETILNALVKSQPPSVEP